MYKHQPDNEHNHKKDMYLDKRHKVIYEITHPWRFLEHFRVFYGNALHTVEFVVLAQHISLVSYVLYVLHKALR